MFRANHPESTTRLVAATLAARRPVLLSGPEARLQPAMSPAAARLGYALEVVIALVLVAAPLGLGGNRVWSWAPLELLVAAGLVIGLIRCAVLGRVAVAGAGLAGAAAVALVAYIALQMIPLPPAVVAALAPGSAHAQTAAAQVLGAAAPAWMTISVDPFATRVELLKLLACAGLFVMVLMAVETRAQAVRLIVVLLLVGVFQAACGMYLRYGGSPALVAMIRDASPDAAGTFVNRNHFAAYLAGPLVLAMAWAVSIEINLGPRRRWLEHGVAWLGSPEVAKRLILMTAALFMGVAMVLSNSRAALAACGLTALVGLVLLARRSPTRRRAAWVAVVVALVLVLGLWKGYNDLAPRLGLGGPDRPELTSRAQIIGGAADTVADHLPGGAGLGAFARVYGPHNTLSTTKIVTHAHNDYVQAAVEIGLIGIGLAIVVALALAVRWGRGLARCRDTSLRLLAGGTALAMLPCLAHSTVDFGLHMPAVAMTAATLAALALALVRLSPAAADLDKGKVAGSHVCHSEHSEESRRGQAEQRDSSSGLKPLLRMTSVSGGLAALKNRSRLAVPVAAVLAVGVSALACLPAAEFVAWVAAREGELPAAPLQAVAACTRALEWTPGNADLLHRRAAAYRSMADAACLDAVPAFLAGLAGSQTPVVVPESTKISLAAVIWARGDETVLRHLHAAVADAQAAVWASPSDWELHLALARLQLDVVRAGDADASALAAADRAAEQALALEPHGPQPAFEIGCFWAARWRQSPSPEAEARYRELLAAAVARCPDLSWPAFEAAYAASGSLDAVEAVAGSGEYARQVLDRFKRSHDLPGAPRAEIVTQVVDVTPPPMDGGVPAGMLGVRDIREAPSFPATR
jgi:O-antigen ligase